LNEHRFAFVSVLIVMFVIAALTIAMFIHDGLNGRVVLSAIILTVFGFGVVGALRHDPDE
jgi:hypothetical protein